MIIFGFIVDYLFLIALSIDTYFFVKDIDKNKLFSVFVVGMLLDMIYHKIFINLFILVLFYFVVKKMKIKNRYYYLKNIILFIIYFNLLNLINGWDLNNYFFEFGKSFLLQIFYLFFCKLL